jgi:hypothetical protein
MKSERWTDGGKSDAPRKLGPNFQENHGRIEGFYSNKVFQHENGSWAFWTKDGGAVSGISTRLTAIEAAQKHYEAE